MQLARSDGFTHVALDWRVSLDIDAVLRGQGADPPAVRARSAALVRLAEQALREGLPLLQPALAFRRLTVKGLRHERLILEDGGRLSGPLIAQQLARAQHVVAIVATIGDRLEARISSVLATGPAYALALDGLGTAAVEALAAAACAHFERLAAADGLQTTLPLSPGMIGWPMDEGQPQIFDLVDAALIGVRRTSGNQMVPRKSLSMVIGAGGDAQTGAQVCDYCSLRQTCRYLYHNARSRTDSPD